MTNKKLHKKIQKRKIIKNKNKKSLFLIFIVSDPTTNSDLSVKEELIEVIVIRLDVCGILGNVVEC